MLPSFTDYMDAIWDIHYGSSEEFLKDPNVKLPQESDQKVLLRIQNKTLQDLVELIRENPEIGHKEAVLWYYSCHDRRDSYESQRAFSQFALDNNQTEYQTADSAKKTIGKCDRMLEELIAFELRLNQIILTYFPTKEILEEVENRISPRSPEILTAKYFLETEKKRKLFIEKPEKIIFNNLFLPPYNTTKSIDIFKACLYPRFVNEAKLWVSDGNENEISILYFFLQKNHLLANLHYTKTEKLICFYQEFGKVVAEKRDTGVDTVIRNITKEIYNSPIESEFENLLRSWMSKK